MSDYYFYDNSDEQRFSEPMPWVGLYVAAASLICSLAMAADAFLGFRNKKLWFPCRFFTLNAATLTLLAVAMKLPVDLTTPMPGDTDQLSKLSSIVFMCTVMGNFMPCLGQMSNKDIFINLTALGILVITIFGNLCIQLGTGVLNTTYLIEKVKFGIGIGILNALILVEAELRIYLDYSNDLNPSLVSPFSDYKWSTFVILFIQTIGIGIGTVAPAIRWFSDIKMKCSGKRGKIFTFEFKTEKYWTEKLEEWRENPLPFEIRSPKFKKLIHITMTLFMSFCIRVQIVIVVASKSIQLLFVSPIVLYKWVLRKFISVCTVSSNHTGSELENASNLNGYVLLLEGEKELPERMLKNIRDGADRLIRKGRKKQPKHIMKLLEKSVGFKGLAEFDSKQDSSNISSYEPPNCWKLALVTLTTIAISLPKIASQTVKDLRSSVSEGLVYVSLVEKVLNAKGDLINSKKAAKVIWLENELYGKWLGIDIRKMALEGKDLKTTLQILSDIAKERFTELLRNTNESVKKNSLKWPVKAIAANSMYRICQTLLSNNECSNIENTTEEMFEKLSVMISDIMSACLTNLPHVIIMKCISSAIEKRDENVQHAARVLGETEEILKFLQHRTLPSLDPDQAAYIDNWIQISQDSQA